MLDTPLTRDYERSLYAGLQKIPGRPLEVWTDATSPPQERIIRMYVTSPTCGGLLAQNNGEGWFPCWPEKPNYPMKGRYYADARNTFEDWRDAVAEAVRPKSCENGRYTDALGARVAVERAAQLRDPFRAAALLAVIGRPNGAKPM